MCNLTIQNHVIEVTVAFSKKKKTLTMILGSKHVKGYNFNNFNNYNKATIKVVLVCISWSET
jgi:hypothetical protein